MKLLMDFFFIFIRNVLGINFLIRVLLDNFVFLYFFGMIFFFYIMIVLLVVDIKDMSVCMLLFVLNIIG